MTLRHRRGERKADAQRIHQLEYDLGLRDDAPPQAITDAPGAVFYYDPATTHERRRARIARMTEILTADPMAAPSPRSLASSADRGVVRAPE